MWILAARNKLKKLRVTYTAVVEFTNFKPGLPSDLLFATTYKLRT